jgi:hypothetical protein
MDLIISVSESFKSIHLLAESENIIIGTAKGRLGMSGGYFGATKLPKRQRLSDRGLRGPSLKLS